MQVIHQNSVPEFQISSFVTTQHLRQRRSTCNPLPRQQMQNNSRLIYRHQRHRVSQKFD